MYTIAIAFADGVGERKRGGEGEMERGGERGRGGEMGRGGERKRRKKTGDSTLCWWFKFSDPVSFTEFPGSFFVCSVKSF